VVSGTVHLRVTIRARWSVPLSMDAAVALALEDTGTGLKGQ
jgi:hypothetical protein